MTRILTPKVTEHKVTRTHQAAVDKTSPNRTQAAVISETPVNSVIPHIFFDSKFHFSQVLSEPDLNQGGSQTLHFPNAQTPSLLLDFAYPVIVLVLVIGFEYFSKSDYFTNLTSFFKTNKNLSLF